MTNFPPIHVDRNTQRRPHHLAYFFQFENFVQYMLMLLANEVEGKTNICVRKKLRKFI